MLTQISGKNRTRRADISPKVREVRETYAAMAQYALLRAYPSMKDFAAELCVLDSGDKLELFWSVLNLGGDAPGGWHQVHDLAAVFERADGETVRLPLSGHIAGFHAWYRMRGGMISILPSSFYFNLEAGEWAVYLEGTLQDVQALCLFADGFHDLFHYASIKAYYDAAKAQMLEKRYVTEAELCPLQPFRIAAGTLKLAEPRTGVMRDLQANRLWHVATRFEDVKDIPAPPVTPPPATPLDPVHYFHDQFYVLQEQSMRLNYCPYDTVNYWQHEPDLTRTHFHVNERTAYFHLEALAPLYRATGDPDVYRAARKWYEWIARNIWPAPGGGSTLACGDRTVFGSALQNGGMSDAVCTFAEIDGNPRWVAPLREGLRDWPMHPTIPRPLMDQDAWGNEEMNTTGTYNMVTHFAVACWKVGHLLDDAALMAKGEFILDNYTFTGEVDGVWPYRPGNFPSHHYDMYLKWQIARLLFTGADRWTKDEAFLARMRRATDATLSRYAEEKDGVILFWDWTHNPNVTHPTNAANHAAAVLETLLAMTLYVDEGYQAPMEKIVKGMYRVLAQPEVARCWHGSWFHVHGYLLALAQHGFHLEGNSVAEMKLVRK